jgi:hypothetical protein
LKLEASKIPAEPAAIVESAAIVKSTAIVDSPAEVVIIPPSAISISPSRTTSIESPVAGIVTVDKLECFLITLAIMSPPAMAASPIIKAIVDEDLRFFLYAKTAFTWCASQRRR